MPELPEVETICCGLVQSIKHKQIVQAETMRAGLRFPFPYDMCERLENAVICNITRRSKYILIALNTQDMWIIHLGMSGKVIIADAMPENLQKHDHMWVRFADDTVLIYNDARRFGVMDICAADKIAEHKLLAKLGPEPLTDKFDAPYLKAALQKKHVPIKNAIMDATIVVGVGNIYACESLYQSRINPQRKSSSLTDVEYKRLVGEIKQVLKQAIASGGSSLRDYVQASGEMGYFQHQFQVYGRENEPCYVCNSVIERMKQQGRSTFYCNTCQR